MNKMYYVYILASQRNGTLYIGVTSRLAQRVWEHKAKTQKGFTSKYGIDQLVWYDGFDDVEAAIQREKTLKKWSRRWKLNLIESVNPEWRDLYDDLGPDI